MVLQDGAWGASSSRERHVKKRHIDPAMIRTSIEQGLSDSEIACRMGWTVGTLRVRCSKLKISLRRHGKKSKSRSARATVSIGLPRTIVDQMVRRAAAMGVSVSSLAADLLTTIDKDDLYNAVLDNDSARAPSLSPAQPLAMDLVGNVA